MILISHRGNINGKITVRMVKLIVGADNQSIADLIETKFMILISG